MNTKSLVNAAVEFGVSEPADFALENGSGPFLGSIAAAEPDELTIVLNSSLVYQGARFTTVKASVRHVGTSFTEWNGSQPLLVNLVLAGMSPVTHLIGGMRLVGPKGVAR